MTKEVVLSGTDNDEMLNGKAHVGIAVGIESAGNPSTLMIPDAANVGDGKPVFLTKPIKLELEHLSEFLKNKDVTLPTELDEALKISELSCEAFYFTNKKEGPLLMMFTIKFTDNLMEKLTGDKDLGKLFTITGGSVRVFKCDKDSFQELENYCAGLLD